jgi:hypothetical protein
MKGPTALEEDWPIVLDMLPPDLEESAYSKLALRRHREVGSAGDLVRLALAYSMCDMSLRQTAAWAQLVGLGALSDVAVLNRLRHAAAWLGHLVLCWLRARGLPTQVPGVRVRIVDATTVSEPGSHGIDWRLHLGLDLAQLLIVSLEVTGPEAGESLRRYTVTPGEIFLADRGYGCREDLASVLDNAGHVVVRISLRNCPLETRAGRALDALGVLETLEIGELGDWPVQIRVEDRVYPLRLVALRHTPEATGKEQKKLQQAAAKRKGRVEARSLRAAAFTCVVTDLPATALPAASVLELYRLRWQVEIAFKQLKGILNFDGLRAKDPQLAQAYLFAKLLGALIVSELSRSAPAFFPWGYALFPAPPQSLALADLVD